MVASLNFLIKKRSLTAKRKRITQKASGIAENFGKHESSSYVDSGETFYEDHWTFEKDGLKIRKHKGAFGHVSMLVEYNTKTVFEGEEYKNKITINAYAPDSKWEKKLNKFYQPINKEIQEEEKKKQQSLRNRFGL